MELLSELIYILKRNRLRSFKDILPKGSKAKKLFNIISKGKVISDKEAAKIIYKGSHTDKKYLMLKRNLVKTLSELIFEVNTFDKNLVNYQKFIFSAKKELMTAEKLLNLNVYHNAERMILKIKASAERSYALEIQIDCVKQLRTVYTLKGFPKEVERYNNELKKLNILFSYELEAIGYISQLESKIKYSIGKYNEIAMEAIKYIYKIKEWRKESVSPMLYLYQLKIDIIRCYHSNDLIEWPVSLKELTDLVSKHLILKTESLKLYLNIEWAKYMRCVSNLDAAAKYIENAIEQSSYAAFNKFEVQALNFDLKIKENNFESAGRILKEIKKSQQFYLLDAQDKAAWILREAYLHFIFLSLNDKTNIEKYSSQFIINSSVSELVNACKAIGKDKKGYNFMLVVIKDCLMQLKYPNQAGEIADKILVYYQRYLKDSCEERSQDFLKNFARMLKLNFLPGEIKQDRKRHNGKSQLELFDAAELIPFQKILGLIKSQKTPEIVST